MNPVVTVVIPTYKRPDRVVRAVDSALNQTIGNVEVIVVDDNGKTSEFAAKTEEVLKEYIKDKKIIYLQNEKNGGGSHARNNGLRIAKGEFITFLDDDDEIAPDKLEKQINKLKEAGSEYSCVYTGYHRIGESGQSTSDEKTEGSVYKYALARAIYVGSGSNLLIRTDIAREIGGYDESFRRNQDLEFMARLLKNHKLAFVDEDLYTIHWEIRDNRLTYDQIIEIDKHYLDTFKDEIDALDKKDAVYVRSCVALERWRKSLSYHKLSDGTANLFKNKVPFGMFVKYVFYLADRVIRKKSYGFKG